MEVKRVLGSERCYLMSDGSKIPFSEKHRIFGNRGIILQPEKTIEIVSTNNDSILREPKKRGRTRKI